MLVPLTLSPAGRRGLPGCAGEKNFLVILRARIVKPAVPPLPDLNVFKYSLAHLRMTHHQRLTVNDFPL